MTKNRVVQLLLATLSSVAACNGSIQSNEHTVAELHALESDGLSDKPLYMRSVQGRESQEKKYSEAARAIVEAMGRPGYDEVADRNGGRNTRSIRSEFEHMAVNAKGSELESLMDPFYVAIPDRRNRIKDVVAEGDIVFVRYQISGTHRGNFYGIAATDLQISIPAVAVFRFATGTLVETWFMADEAGFLRQIGQRLPTRKDEMNSSPSMGSGSARPANDVLADMQLNLEDSIEFKNKLKVVTRRTSPRPPGRPYLQNLRRGHYHIVDAGRLYGDTDAGFGSALSNRVDRIEYLVSNESTVAIMFRLTAINTGSMFGLPATNTGIDNWEISFAWFENGEWINAWFFGDDLEMLRQLSGGHDYLVPVVGNVQPSAITE